jgi:putative FmdB family regulatory protein
MPIYEYQCMECGEEFERFQPFGNPQPIACPKGHQRVHRRLSRPAIIFKGSGFYVTDNPRNGRSASSSSSSGERAKKTSEPDDTPAASPVKAGKGEAAT